MMSQNNDLTQAFRWTNKTLPSKYKTSSVSYYQAFELALICGVMFGTALFLLQRAFFSIGLLNWILSMVAGLVFINLELYIYKRTLS